MFQQKIVSRLSIDFDRILYFVQQQKKWHFYIGFTFQTLKLHLSFILPIFGVVNNNRVKWIALTLVHRNDI